MEIKKPILIKSIVYLIFVISLILVYGINYDNLNKKYNEVLNELNYYHNIDTNAIHKIDSIEYNIRQKDSIIYHRGIESEIREEESMKTKNVITFIDSLTGEPVSSNTTNPVEMILVGMDNAKLINVSYNKFFCVFG